MKAAMLPHTVRTAMIMGLPFSVHLRSSKTNGADPSPVAAPGSPELDAAVEAVWAELRWADQVFSTYRDDSDISRIRRGELRVREADQPKLAILRSSDRLRVVVSDIHHPDRVRAVR